MKLSEIKATVFSLLNVANCDEFSRKRLDLFCIGDLRKKSTWQDILAIIEIELAEIKRVAVDFVTAALSNFHARAPRSIRRARPEGFGA